MKLTVKETKFLIEKIESYLINFENEIEDKEKQSFKLILIDLKHNISINRKNFLQLLSKLVNEDYYNLKERIEYFNNKSDLEIFRNTELEKKEIEHIIDLICLRNKFLKKDDQDYLERLSNPFDIFFNLPSNKCYYSKSGNEIYKIGIPINKIKLVKVKLSSKSTSFLDSIKVRLDIKTSKNSFTYEGYNSEIIEMINKYGKLNKLTDNMVIIKEILEKNK